MQHDTTTTPANTCPSHPTRPGEPIWCNDCRNDLADTLWRLPALHDRLLAAADGQATRTTLTRGGTRIDPASPSPEFDQADEMDTTLAEWAAAWLDHLGSTEVRGRTTGWAARVLGDTRGGRDAWAWHEAADLGRAVRILAGRARRLLGGSGDVEHIPLGTPCGSCGGRLRREDGTDRVTCRGCPRTMTWTEYQGWLVWLIGQRRAA
ncbi:hypothetical protein [Embleya sp. NPDC020630]|uniref:hypothetical protein n=1 Tax=Embleya sp. NPDC020630 TaxID=3363979 RepID=UPI0037A3F32E